MKYVMKSRKNGYLAYAEYKNDKVIVLKDSSISKQVADFKMVKKALEERNRSENFLGNVLVKDVQFDSMSTAAQFVAGYSVSGKRAWKEI